MNLRSIIAFVFLVSIFSSSFAEGGTEAGKFTLSGKVKDASTGEYLPGVNIFIKEINNGTTTNSYGFYSITLPVSKYSLEFSYIGYEKVVKEINLTVNQVINMELKPISTTLEEVEITARPKDENVKSTEMSVVKMDIKTINKIPALLGEVDILKTLQLFPGVQSAGEGSTGYSVRGGGTDQNLILMDEAQVYNASHLMGFFSIFNNDAVKELTLYKGDMPASYGGRLASLLDVKQKDGNNKKYGVTGGLGLISSRLMVEGPIVKNTSSFLIAGRRSYADLFIPLANNENLDGSKLYFYDFNAKLNYEINDNNRVFVSGYMGRDVVKMTQGPGFGLDWGNKTVSFRWNHIFTKKLFTNFTATLSDYTYDMGTDDDQRGFSWVSRMKNHSFKMDNGYYLNPNNTVKFGVFASYHQFYPGTITSSGTSSVVNDFMVPNSQAFEYGIFIENEQKIGSLLKLNYGLRYTIFSNVGPGTVYNFDENFVNTDSTVYNDWDIYNTYGGFEPRLSFTYLLSEKSSIKGSYSRTMQFVQLASNSTVGNPLSIWFPSSPNVKPQFADQGALGYFRNFKDNMIETSVEVFYKKMNNQIDFKDHAQLLINPMLEGELRFGYGEAYGLELLVRKQTGKLTGWIAYTLSRSVRYFDDINDGKAYLSPFDKPHDVAIVADYQFTKRISASASWVYSSGSTATFPTGRFIYGNVIAPVYSDRNDYRLPDYHRLDLGLTINEKEKPGRKYHHSWVFSVYNAYNRHNTYSIAFETSEDDPNKQVAMKTYLFGIIPSVTFNFNF